MVVNSFKEFVVNNALDDNELFDNLTVKVHTTEHYDWRYSELVMSSLMMV